MEKLRKLVKRAVWPFRKHATCIEELLASRRVILQQSIDGTKKTYFLLEELPSDEMAIWNSLNQEQRFF